MFSAYYSADAIHVPQRLTMGSGGLPISVNRALLVLFFTMTAFTLRNQVVHMSKVAPNSFGAVVHHMCEASYMKQVWVKDDLQCRWTCSQVRGSVWKKQSKILSWTCKLRKQSSILVDTGAWLAVSIMLQSTGYVFLEVSILPTSTVYSKTSYCQIQSQR